ncbi:GTP-binding protein Rhes [Haematobia irritans]|uniref:GTP-binding protein Rhes n=1 Tax=Haematobia irritans TaxID=7368 RepID=UPI003F50644A
MNANMIRCKNWFCARNNNNDYADVLFGDSNKASSSTTSPQQQQTATTTTSSAGAITTIPPTSKNDTTITTTNANMTRQYHQPVNGKIPTGTGNMGNHTSASASGHVGNAVGAVPGGTGGASGSGSGSHVVTFLDDVPSGSNGVVNTTTRLMNHSDLHSSGQEHHHLADDLDVMDDDFIANHVVSSSLLCDDTLPGSKNCYRLVILGSSRSGKSSIVARFLGNRFEEAYTPTIEDFHRKLYRIRNEVYQLDILDTSGYHPFPAMRRLSFLTGDLFILVFSMDSRESFEEVVRLRENILETKWAALNPGSGFKKKALPKIPMVLAGNKCDKDQRTVQLDEVMGYIAGQDNCCVFVECSAKQNFRIDDLFYALFTASNLPLEMAPNHHRRVVTVFGAPSPLPPHSSAGATKKNALSIKRRFSDACGVVTPNARRPSIRTDLNLMRSKTMAMNEGESSVTRKKCIIM